MQQSKEATEELQAEEEEMRQNMEELDATQEDLSRREKDYLDKILKLENGTTEIQELAISSYAR